MEKIKLYSLLFISMMLLVTSCLSSDNSDLDEWYFGNAQISAFSLSNDSIPDLSSVVFTIDQINGKIFNKDSMPYGTVLDEKVICTMSYEIGIQALLIYHPATDDSIYWDGSDSIDFSEPVMLTAYAYNGTSKTYEAKVNIHQVNPDSMAWQQLDINNTNKDFDELQVVVYNNSYYYFASDNGKYHVYTSDIAGYSQWTELPLTDFPDNVILSQVTIFEDSFYVATEEGSLYYSHDAGTWTKVLDAPFIKSLTGTIPSGDKRTESVLTAVINKEDGLYFSYYDKNGTWYDGEKAPSSFPLTGFSHTNYNLMYYPRLVIAAGRDKNGLLTNGVWTTSDGLQWIPLAKSEASFTPREGASISYYDDMLYLLGGMDESANALHESYISKDNGLTWRLDTIIPETYKARGFSSLIVDKDKYMLLFGGKESKDTKVLNELLKGRINRFGFKDQ
jgi:hypothetical protein